MATLTTLRPDGTGTLSLVNNQAASTVDIHLDIDDDPDSPTTTDYVKNSNDTTGDKTAFFLLTATDADFSSMITLSVDIDLRPTGFTDDTCTLFARMYQADETTTLSNEITVATQATAAGLVTAAFTGLSAGSKAIWDGARIRFRWAYTRNMAADGATLRVTAVELDGTYVPQVDVAGSDTATLAEAATLSADLSLADTAALTEQITTLGATLSAADSATLTERAEIGLTAADSALLAEQATLLASPATSDSAILSETALVGVEPTRPDTPLVVSLDTGVVSAAILDGGGRALSITDDGIVVIGTNDGIRSADVAAGELFVQLAVDTPARGLYLPGTAGNYISTPDDPNFTMSGDLDLRLHFSFDTWTAATLRTIFAHYNPTGNQRSWRFFRSTTNLFQYQYSADGATVVAQPTLTAAPALVDGEPIWLRITHDVDNGAGQNVVRWYDSADGVTWNLLETDTVATAITLFDSNTLLTLGSTGTGNERMTGEMLYAELRSGIDGTIVAKFDPSLVTITSDTDPGTVVQQGETWTVNGSAWHWLYGTPAPESAITRGLAVSDGGQRGYVGSDTGIRAMALVGDGSRLVEVN